MILVISIIIYIFAPRGTPVSSEKWEVLHTIVEDGDIICRLGGRFWSLMFRDASSLDRRYSHMGIIRIYDDRITVVHAEGDTGHGRDGVNEVPLEDFVTVARAIGIYRAKNINREEISTAALDYLGIPFDWKFDMSDESEIYCTELLYIILKRIAPETELHTVFVKEVGKEVIPLEAVSNSPDFIEVYYIKSNR